MDNAKDAIIFIDGNNLYHNLKAIFVKPGSVSLDKLCKFVCSHFGYTLKKVMYYNSVPSIDDGKEVYYGHMKFLDEIRKFPNFVVHTRKLQRNSTAEKIKLVHEEVSKLGLCKVCQPMVKAHWADYIGSINTKEKGIDVMIAVQMIETGIINNECDACILISGDADFIPSMDIIKQRGKEVMSASVIAGYSFDLRKNHRYFIINKQDLIKNCSK